MTGNEAARRDMLETLEPILFAELKTTFTEATVADFLPVVRTRGEGIPGFGAGADK